MIVCTVCSHSNDDFAIKCVSCGSFIQDRVPNLDLFAIIWLLIESPAQAFKKIIIAEHKNFVLFLSVFLGINGMFALMWANKTGNSFDNLFPLLLFGTVLGIVIGIPLFFVLTGIVHGTAIILKGRAAFKETYGIIGWSLVPVMLAVVFILPLQFSSLGLLLFATNPSAYEVKPVVTMILLGLNGSMVVWSILLASVGLSMAHRIRLITGALVVLAGTGIAAYISVIIYSSFNI